MKISPWRGRWRQGRPNLWRRARRLSLLRRWLGLWFRLGRDLLRRRRRRGWRRRRWWRGGGSPFGGFGGELLLLQSRKLRRHHQVAFVFHAVLSRNTACVWVGAAPERRPGIRHVGPADLAVLFKLLIKRGIAGEVLTVGAQIDKVCAAASERQDSRQYSKQQNRGSQHQAQLPKRQDHDAITKL